MTKARENRKSRSGQARLCASCGAPYQPAYDANYGRSLRSLLTADRGAADNLCPACRQRDVARRIGPMISART
jgi:hypothetical protein